MKNKGVKYVARERKREGEKKMRGRIKNKDKEKNI